MGRLGSEVRVSVSFQTIPCLMGRLGLEVRVSDSSRSFDLRMFVCHGRHVFAVSSAISCARKVIFLSCPVMFSKTLQCRRCVFSTDHNNSAVLYIGY